MIDQTTALKFLNDILSNAVYRIEFRCIVSEDMHLPKHIKAQYGIGNGIVLAVNSRIKHNLEIDGLNIYWDTSFNQMPYTVKVHLRDVVAIVDTVSQTGVQLQPINNTIVAPPVFTKHKPVIPAPKTDLKVVSNTDAPKTPPRGKLSIVK